MAAGLPVITDNHSGMKDRVTDETGFRCDNYEQYLEVIKLLSAKNGPEILKKMGENARQRAKDEFVAEKWIEEVISQ
jgi:glycosyltransferase involved in cell wall biosynthesis